MSDFQDQNFDDTGASSGSLYQYLNLKLIGEEKGAKKCVIKQGKDGPEYDSFICYLVNMLPPEFREPTGRIPARHEYKLILKAKDTSDNQVKEFCLTLSSHWGSPIFADVMNQLAGACGTPGWDHKVRFSVYSKETKNKDYVMRACLYTGKDGPKLPYKFPWEGDRDGGRFIGVPEPATDNNGVKNFKTVSDFWHKEYELLVAYFQKRNGGLPVTAPQPQQQTQQTNTPATQTTAPGANTGATPALAERTMKWVTASYEKLLGADKNPEAFFALMITGFAKMATQNPTEADYADACKRANDLAGYYFIPMPPGHVFQKDGSHAPGAPATSPFDDSDTPF